jgi:hypothetical protein
VLASENTYKPAWQHDWRCVLIVDSAACVHPWRISWVGVTCVCLRVLVEALCVEGSLP